MKGKFKTVFFILFCTFIISTFLVFDLFIHSGVPVTFDGPTHISNIAQIHRALVDGEFPARWGGGFARYGMPIPIIAQQVTSYLGAFITFITHNVISSYNIVVFIGAFISTVLMYMFLRLHVSMISAMAGALLFNFAPYRIMNIYIRGSLPEFFASVFIIMILISLHEVIKKEKNSAFLLLIVSVALLLLTHPFMFVVGSFLFIPYGLYLLAGLTKAQYRRIIPLIIVCIGLAGGIAAYYLVPLFIEIRYFYYAQSVTHFAQGHFMTLKNYGIDQWFYFYNNDIFPRGHVHLGGSIEGFILFVSLAYSIWQLKVRKEFSLLTLFSITGVIIIVFTLPISEVLYMKTPLGNIQHPWRMLSAYIFIAPILGALLIEKVHNKTVVFFIIIFAVGVLRFPQLYGKNYTIQDQRMFYNTDYNLHGIFMNTVWMGDERTYPYKKQKVEIIEGKGTIENVSIKNASRRFVINALTDVKMADYTFYFPGWKAYVDKAETPIQFQDPAYRGVITYTIPKGTHTVELIFGETTVRKLGNVLTLLSGGVFVVLVILRKKIQHWIYE